jgi:hypothetical protein
MSDNKIDCTKKVSRETITTVYLNAGFTPPDNVTEALTYLYNTTIHFPNPRETTLQDDLHFNVKKIVKNHPKQYLEPYLSELSVVNLTPIAEKSSGYMVLLVDEYERIYGVYDNLILLYGKTIAESLENILQGKHLKTLSQ